MPVLLRKLTGLFLSFLFIAPAVFAAPVATVDDYRSPKEVFDRMEASLMKIRNRKVKFRIEATGAVTSTFEGELVFKKGNVMDYRTSGKFTGRDHKLFLTCDGTNLRGGADGGSGVGAKPFEQACPDGLRASMLIGMSRMGLMHNIARLTGNKPPDRMDKTVYDWLVVQDAKFAKDHAPDTPQAGAELKHQDKKLMVVFYKLGVDKEKNAGDVELWIDTKTNLPAYRSITVHFPNGDMFVTEKYEWSKI